MSGGYLVVRASGESYGLPVGLVLEVQDLGTVLDVPRTHPAVRAALARGSLALHAWVYEIETGDVFQFDPAGSQFSSITGGAERPSPSVVQRTSI